MARRKERSGNKRTLIARAAALLACLPPFAAADDGPVPLFSDDAVLPVRIEAPLTTLLRERSDTTELDGFLYYTDENGAEQALEVKVRARGRYRRKPDTCTFPPVRLNFRKGQLDDTLFAGIDKLKLVTHCKNTSTYEQNVLEEHLAYRILNTLTERSFRTRLLRIAYVNSERDGETENRYGFLIEDDALLEDRLAADLSEVPSIDYSVLHPDQAALVSVFQYLIGNTDFSMVLGPADDACCHNVVLYTGDEGRFLPIPYDFDFSGLVNARYATPNPRLKIKRVTTRLYRGHCSFNGHVETALGEVMAQREPILALIDDIEGMDDKSRKSARRYLERFYKDMSRPDSAERYFIKGCS